MKKILALLMVFLLITGCGDKKEDKKVEESKELNCSNTSYDIDQYVVFYFDVDGTKLKTFDQTLSLSYDDTDSYAEEEISAMESSCDEYKNYKGTSCNVNKKDKKIEIVIKYDLDKMDETAIKELYVDEVKDLNYDDTVKYMKENDFTCK